MLEGLGQAVLAPYSPSVQYGSAAPNTSGNIQAYCNSLKAAQYGTALPFPVASAIGVDCNTLTTVGPSVLPGTPVPPSLPSNCNFFQSLFGQGGCSLGFAAYPVWIGAGILILLLLVMRK